MKWIWQYGFNIVECSMRYNMKRTQWDSYDSNLVNAQVHKTSQWHTSNNLLITVPIIASL